MGDWGGRAMIMSARPGPSCPQGLIPPGGVTRLHTPHSLKPRQRPGGGRPFRDEKEGVKDSLSFSVIVIAWYSSLRGCPVPDGVARPFC